MKADWGLLGGAAAAMLALPLLVLAWSGTPLGTGLPGGTTSSPAPTARNRKSHQPMPSLSSPPSASWMKPPARWRKSPRRTM